MALLVVGQGVAGEPRVAGTGGAQRFPVTLWLVRAVRCPTSRGRSSILDRQTPPAISQVRTVAAVTVDRGDRRLDEAVEVDGRTRGIVARLEVARAFVVSGADADPTGLEMGHATQAAGCVRRINRSVVDIEPYGRLRERSR